ncbi:hypothetical protein GY45DRAFT_793733 [Cubamyces sp. BRFM 1775]|nr:hypothetical protein GY45DRAFT_793733 [Cubamyces sp. BRFM 1775]
MLPQTHPPTRSSMCSKTTPWPLLQPHLRSYRTSSGVINCADEWRQNRLHTAPPTRVPGVLAKAAARRLHPVRVCQTQPVLTNGQPSSDRDGGSTAESLRKATACREKMGRGRRGAYAVGALALCYYTGSAGPEFVLRSAFIGREGEDENRHVCIGYA